MDVRSPMIAEEFRTMIIFFKILGSLFIESTGGNIFIGPRHRGPLDPGYETTNDMETSYRSFEFDSEPIIGRERYEEM